MSIFASKTPRDLNPHGVIMTGAGTLTRMDPPKPSLMNTGPGAHWDTPDEHDGRL